MSDTYTHVFPRQLLIIEQKCTVWYRDIITRFPSKDISFRTNIEYSRYLLRKSDKIFDRPRISIDVSPTRLINFILHGHSCKILYESSERPLRKKFEFWNVHGIRILRVSCKESRSNHDSMNIPKKMNLLLIYTLYYKNLKYRR